MDVDAFYSEESARWIELRARFQQIPAPAWDRPGACGDWTPKDVMAHLAGWHRYLATLLATYARGLDPRKPLSAEVIDEMNAGFVATYRDWDLGSLLMLSRDEHARAVVGVRAASFRKFDDGWESTIRDNTTAHYDEHVPLIDAFIKEHG